MNTSIDFEIAKLLKEKGFDEPTLNWYHKDTKKFNINDLMFSMNKITDNYSAPTIADVIMWLYEKHEIWIWVERYSTLFRPYAEEVGSERFGKWEGHKFDSPTEAYSGAITYTLNNLIK